LQSDDRVPDIGCAKGFFKDLRDALPGLIDTSDYALDNARPDAKPYLSMASCDDLSFDSSSFPAVFTVNSVHNLERHHCRRTLQQIERICPGRGFLQFGAYRAEVEREVFLEWMLTDPDLPHAGGLAAHVRGGVVHQWIIGGRSWKLITPRATRAICAETERNCPRC
jgi:SAM-dependent methyltransferase